MAKCPNCGRKLHLYNWKPNCPDCGVNLVYFRSNEILLNDSEKAEIEHAYFQPKVDRVKAATIGSKFGIARIVISALPLAAAFLPLVKLCGADGAAKYLNAYSLYTNYISSVGFGNVFGNAFAGDFIALSVVLLLVALVSSLIIGLLSMMSLGKYGKIRNLILNSFQVLLSVGSLVCFSIGGKDISYISETYTKGALFIGAFVVAGLYITLLVYNLVVAKIGIKVNYTPCFIGGLPSEEYFQMVNDGVSELEIRKKMVTILTDMQNEFRRKDAEAKAKEEAEAEERRNRRKR